MRIFPAESSMTGNAFQAESVATAAPPPWEQSFFSRE